MKIHRFYTPDIDLDHDLWLKTPELLHQWNKVLRFRAGQQVVLFDGETKDNLYKITEISPSEAHMELVTKYARREPKSDVYLFWSLLKKDKNDWVLQKCTELGVNHFIPLIADRSEKTGFNMERAQKIVVEASEQCGRSNIPKIRDAMHVQNAIEQYNSKIELYICEQDSSVSSGDGEKLGVLIGPEGGWSDEEKKMFVHQKLKHLNLSDFTLRAETAAVTSATKLLQ